MTDDQQHGVISTISTGIIRALPGQMLLVLLLNIAFLSGLFWLLSQQNASRERALLPMLEACSKTIPLEAFPHGIYPAPPPGRQP
jgi:hypothetical protein